MFCSVPTLTHSTQNQVSPSGIKNVLKYQGRLSYLTNKEALAGCYTLIKHDRHLRTRGKCRNHSPAARVFYLSRVFSNVRSGLSQCNTRLELPHLLYDIEFARAKLIKQNIYMIYLSYRPQVSMVYLTNRFHVAVRHLLGNRSQMTSKCVKNKKVTHEAIAECVTDFFSDLITEQTHGTMKSICFI